MGMFPVSGEKELRLRERLMALGVQESDLDETFIRSGGAGGQHVNKTSTCVVIIHRPTGIQVRCQESRSQALNRFIARRMLADRMEERQTGRVTAERAKVEKIRRQKRRRSRRSKNRMLEEKHRRSDIKSARKSPRRDD